MKYLRLAPLALLLLAAVAPATAAVIFQDGFNGIATPPYDTIAGGGTQGPWSVGGAGIDWIHSYWQHAEGDGSVDLSSMTAGSVSTTLATVAGQVYNLSFYLAGNPDGGDAVKSVQVTVGSLNQQFDFTMGGATKGNMGWILVSTQFTAAGNDVLTFLSLENNPYGSALDLVTVDEARVSNVPEPGSALLVLAGLAGAAALLRRR